MSTQTKTVINRQLLENALSYDAYREMIDNLLEEGKTTGDNHSDAYIHYTKMNVQRMSRLEKTIELTDDLKAAIDDLDHSITLLALTEAWCGDAAQNLVVFYKMEQYSDNILLKLILRDENLDVMDEYLTNGGRAIPKVIALESDSLNELWTWGPRPAELQAWYMDVRKKDDFDYQEVVKELQKWYAKDKTKTQQLEITELLRSH